MEDTLGRGKESGKRVRSRKSEHRCQRGVNSEGLGDGLAALVIDRMSFKVQLWGVKRAGVSTQEASGAKEQGKDKM